MTVRAFFLMISTSYCYCHTL